MELPRWADVPPALVGALGSMGGVVIAWGLADKDLFLVWALASAVLLLALSQRFPAASHAASHAAPRGAGWTCGALLRNAAGLLLTIAWLDGPSPLALMTAFWAQRLFAEWNPTVLQFLNRREGEFSTTLGDVVPAMCAFSVVMLPLRICVEAPWGAVASIQ